jgi:murein DD-endopeptidase MepM/ murein hydrolase activator NlpD
VAAAPGSGTVLILDHDDGISTFFAHLQSTAVVPGQRVTRGDDVARVGSSGRSTGAHLHLEVWVEGVPVNPALYIDGCSAGSVSR